MSASNNGQSKAVALPTFGQLINNPQSGLMDIVKQVLNNPDRASRFVAAVTAVVNNSAALSECWPKSILSGALLGESLGLAHNPALGQYYLVPFKDKKNPDGYKKSAQFVLGYKGYIQLAFRSGAYKKLNVEVIKEGELFKVDSLNEEFDIRLIDDEAQREKLPTIGYYAMFEYHNGLRKAMYWSKSKMRVHADTFSKAYNAKADDLLKAGKIREEDMWKYSSFWYTDFDVMARKTMLRQLISKWGVMSVEMQQAFDADDRADRGEPINLVPNDAGVYDEKPAEQPQEPAGEQKPTVSNPERKAPKRASLKDV